MLIEEYNRLKNRMVERVSQIETELKPLVIQRDELNERIDTLRNELYGLNAALGYHTKHGINEVVELPEWKNLPELDGSTPSKMGEVTSPASPTPPPSPEPVVVAPVTTPEPVVTPPTEVSTPVIATLEPAVPAVTTTATATPVTWVEKTMTQRAMEFLAANRTFKASELVKELNGPAGHHPSTATFVNLFLKKKLQGGHLTFDGVTYEVKPVAQAIPAPLASGAQWKCNCSFHPWNRATTTFCSFCKCYATDATEFRTTTPENFSSAPPAGTTISPVTTTTHPAPPTPSTTVTVKSSRKLGAVSIHGDYPPGVATHTRELIDYMRERAHHSHTLDEIVKWYTAKGITSPANTLRHNANQALMDLVQRKCLERTGKGKYRVTNYLNYVVPTTLTDIDRASMTIDELVAYQTP